MIIYFSATNNSKYVAQKLSKTTNDNAYSIVNLTNTINTKTLGIISPTYAWGLPIIVKEYLEQLSFINKPDYIYFIATYGTTPGACAKFVNDILKRKSLSLSASFSIKMPDTWTPIFDLNDKTKIDEINKKADIDINEIISKVNNKELGDFTNNKMPYALSKLINKYWYEEMRKTKHFNIEDTCIGCGLCQRNCPIKAIKIINNKPTWTKDKCIMCLSCLHHCPKFAIQYGKSSKKHGQYTHKINT